MSIDGSVLLLITGAVLLGVAALSGFAQAATERGSESESKWRVVHSGGTAGGVQLVALSAVWGRLAEQANASIFVAWCLALSSWLFFIGPLLKALGRSKMGNTVLWVGVVPSIPAYLGLVGLALGLGYVEV